jgi:dipeptidyl aminopeptidase/acylaminoacyl peptidase
MTQPLLPSDLYRFAIAADPQIALDGVTVIYRRSVFDAENDAAGGALWRVHAGGPDVPFTSGKNDRLPRIAADGSRVAFVRDVDEKTRIHLIPLDGGEAHPIGEECNGISSLAWSPDGLRLAYTATAAFDPATAHLYLDEKTGARHIRALPYKGDLEGLHDGRRTHLFVLDVADGAVRQLTSGDFDAGAAAWSPDGRTIAISLGAAAEASMISDVVLIDCQTRERRFLTGGDGPNAAPTFSPDGRRIAWLGHRHGDDTRYAAELFVAGVDGSERRSLSVQLDRPAVNVIGGDLRSGSPAAPRWRNDREILALVSDGGCTSLRAFDADSGHVAVVAGGEREIYAFSPAAAGAVALLYSTPLVPSEVALLNAGGDERCLTALNAWLSERPVVAPRKIHASAADGTQLEAWLMLPAANGAPPPVVLEIHGGPHAAYGNTFFLEFQILAACGFAVVYGNPRGSSGYGQAFASAITGDWGGVDAGDVLSILDAALLAERLDATRVAAVGGSYGGFMTTWLLGHTERFVTGISMRACNDFVSFIGATDIGFFFKAELGLGLDADSMRELFDRSPMRAAADISVPMLILHSERDYRCPIDQGEQLFNLLRMLGNDDVEFVRFTGDGHELSRGGKPRHRVLRLRAIARWLGRHLGARPRVAGNEVPGSLFQPLDGEPA